MRLRDLWMMVVLVIGLVNIAGHGREIVEMGQAVGDFVWDKVPHSFQEPQPLTLRTRPLIPIDLGWWINWQVSMLGPEGGTIMVPDGNWTLVTPMDLTKKPTTVILLGRGIYKPC